MNPLIIRFLPHIAGVAIIAGGVWYYGHTRYNAGEADERAKWEAASQEAGARFAEALQDQQTTLLKADSETLIVRRDIKGIEDKLDEALKTPEGSDWGSTPLPDGVRLSVNQARDSSVSRDPRLTD